MKGTDWNCLGEEWNLSLLPFTTRKQHNSPACDNVLFIKRLLKCFGLISKCFEGKFREKNLRKWAIKRIYLFSNSPLMIYCTKDSQFALSSLQSKRENGDKHIWLSAHHTKISHFRWKTFHFGRERHRQHRLNLAFIVAIYQKFVSASSTS